MVLFMLFALTSGKNIFFLEIYLFLLIVRCIIAKLFKMPFIWISSPNTLHHPNIVHLYLLCFFLQHSCWTLVFFILLFKQTPLLALSIASLFSIH